MDVGAGLVVAAARRAAGAAAGAAVAAGAAAHRVEALVSDRDLARDGEAWRTHECVAVGVVALLLQVVTVLVLLLLLRGALDASGGDRGTEGQRHPGRGT